MAEWEPSSGNQRKWRRGQGNGSDGNGRHSGPKANANGPKQGPATGKQKVLQVLESPVRGVQRLNAVRKRVDPKVLESLLAKVQAPPLAEIGNMKTLRDVVLGLEQLAGTPAVEG